MKNKTKIEPMDERQKQIQAKATACGYSFLCLCLVVAMTVKLIQTDEIGWEFFALLGGCAVIIIARRFLGDVEQPKDIWGKPLPLGSSKEDRRARKKDYALGSCIFAGTCAIMETLLIAFGKTTSDLELTEFFFPALSRGAAIALSAVIGFVTMFLISYIFDYMISEHFKVKRYNKMLAELEDD